MKFHNDPDRVANIKACIPLVNKPRKIKGIGITKGTKETKHNIDNYFFFNKQKNYKV